MKDVREVGRAGPRPPGRAGPGHDPVPRRGPPVQPHPAGRAAARTSRRACSSSSAPPPRTRSSRSPARCSRAPRCSGSSRSTADELRALLQRALTDDERGLGDEHLAIDDDALDHLADRAEGDARHALTSLEVAAALASGVGPRRRSRSADSEAALALRALRYGDDEHYDVLSAFIKSIRGSDVDAGLYWLARMLDGGGGRRASSPAGW